MLSDQRGAPTTEEVMARNRKGSRPLNRKPVDPQSQASRAGGNALPTGLIPRSAFAMEGLEARRLMSANYLLDRFPTLTGTHRTLTGGTLSASAAAGLVTPVVTTPAPTGTPTTGTGTGDTTAAAPPIINPITGGTNTRTDTGTGTHTGTGPDTGTGTGTTTDPSAPTAWTLIDAEHDVIIGALHDGDVLDFAQLPSRQLSLKVVFPGKPGSVRFGVDNDPNFRLELLSNWAIQGEKGGDYGSWTPALARIL